MHKGSIGSRTLSTGAKPPHTCLWTATPIHLDRARQKDAAEAAAEAEEAPIEVKEEGADGLK
jgi:hypothetical protein